MTSRYVTRKDREKALKQTNFTFEPCGTYIPPANAISSEERNKTSEE